MLNKKVELKINNWMLTRKLNMKYRIYINWILLHLAYHTKIECKYYLISTSYLVGLFDNFILLHIWQNCVCFIHFQHWKRGGEGHLLQGENLHLAKKDGVSTFVHDWKLKKDLWPKYCLQPKTRLSRQAQSGIQVKIHSWSMMHGISKICEFAWLATNIVHTLSAHHARHGLRTFTWKVSTQ